MGENSKEDETNRIEERSGEKRFDHNWLCTVNSEYQNPKKKKCTSDTKNKDKIF